jgi:[acyl-carrier-protein] S-malonyltransferase
LKLAFVFPGQGAQYVGMGTELAARYQVARDTLKTADDVLGFGLSDLCARGPESSLRLTYHTQPALLAISVAALRVFQEVAGIQPVVVAGHSLGEYSALVAAGILSFEDAVQLVHWRGRWMDEAVPAGKGAMSAVLGMEPLELAQVCAEAGAGEEVAELANLNCPGQIVISGSASAVERAGLLAKEKGAKRVIPLEVSGPFHSSLMKPAAGKLIQALTEVEFHESSIPVVANVDAVARTDVEGIRSALESQLYMSVRWEDDVRTMLDMGVDGFVEFGPGTVLSGLIRKVERRIPTFHVEDDASLQETLQTIRL